MRHENWTRKSQELQILHLLTNIIHPRYVCDYLYCNTFSKTGEQHVEGNAISIDTVSDQIALHS